MTLRMFQRSLGLSLGLLLSLDPSLSRAEDTQLPIPAPLAAPLQPGQLQTNIVALFNKESTAVTFTYRPANPASGKPRDDRRYILIQADENGHEIHRLGPLLDDGILGDRVAHDGIYSRKFQLNEKKPGATFYAVRDELAEPSPTMSAAVKIDVIEHPAIQVLLKRIWARIRGENTSLR